MLALNPEISGLIASPFTNVSKEMPYLGQLPQLGYKNKGASRLGAAPQKPRGHKRE